MKKIVKTITLGVVATMAVACASQSNPTSDNQRPSGQQGGQQGPPAFSQLLAEMDANKDGKLAKSEMKGPIANDFSKIDTDKDGFISESEFKNAPAPQRNGPRQ